MKKLKFTCPHCEAKLRVPTHLAGVSAPCPKCGETITAPSDITTAVLEPAGVRRTPAAGATPVRTRVEPPAPVGTTLAPAAMASTTAVMEPPQSSPLAPPDPVVAELPEALSRSAPSVRPSASAAALPVPAPAETRVDLAPSSPMMERTGNVTPSTAPAFFTPPPPIRPLTPPDPVEDERSAPPVSLENETQVVVEEQYFEEGPIPPLPSTPITQPIQISSPRGDFPPASELSKDGHSLPRLDVSLAGETKTLSVKVPAEPAVPARTRVFLPQPGAAIQPSTPEDFLTPPGSREEVPATRPSVPQIPQEEGIPAVPGIFRQPSEVRPRVTDAPYTTIPIPSEQDAIPLDELEGEPDWEDETVGDFEGGLEGNDALGLPPAPDSPDFATPDWADDVITDIAELPLPNDRSGERSETGTSSVRLHSDLANPVPRSQPSSGPEVGDELAPDALHEGAIANLFTQKAPSPEAGIPADRFSKEPTAASPSRERDLDSLFDTGRVDAREEKGVSRTMIVMIASVVVVAIIAGVGVILVINSFLGGFSPAEAYKETEGEVAPVESKGSVAKKPRIPTSSSTALAPDLSIKDAPAVVDPPALSREGGTSATGSDAPALSFDEKVQQMVNGRGASVIGSPSLDIVEKPVTDFSGTPAAAQPVAAGAGTAAETAPETAVTAVAGALGAGTAPFAAPSATAPAAAKDANYNPPDSFPAPAPGDTSTLGKTHDLIDAFLRAPDVATRMKYTFQGESLRAAVEDYHKKWPFGRFERYSLQLYQMELDKAIGGPYWVFIVSTRDEAEGFPFIVRTENGLLKADWEIFAEFSDRQFLRFRDGKMAPPATFRLILERFTDYYGSDRDAFTDLGDYLVYQVYPPYGETEFSEFVFVKKDSELGRKLDKLVGIGDEPLAVVVTLDQQAFAHGVKHYVLSELVTEGWFR